MRNQFFLYVAGLLVLLLIPLFIFLSKDSDSDGGDGQNGSEQNENEKEEKPNGDGINPDDIIWGVDSASSTTEELYACVAEEFGKPEIWGRYIGENEDVSEGLTKEEIDYLHSNDVKVLLIYNHVTDVRGYDNGASHADQAIKLAEELGVPDGKAIFVDIEPTYPVDAEFIKGWFDQMNESAYAPGIYGVFSEEQELYSVYSQAIGENEKLKESTVIWTAYPQHKITSKENAPEYKPSAPDEAYLLGWQYGLDAKSCNIDTNLFKGEVIEYLW